MPRPAGPSPITPEPSWATIARLAVSAGLLVLAGVLVIGQPDAGELQLATVIVGAVIGYWLSHAEHTIR